MSMFSPHAHRTNPAHTGLIRALIRYHGEGDYARDLAAVGAQAMAKLKATPARGKNRALVLDIDETSLINDWPKLVDPDHGAYDPKAWQAWIESASAPAVGSTVELFETAKGRGLDVFFITGRHPDELKATERNLLRAGFKGWTEIIGEPLAGPPPGIPTFPTAAAFKTSARWSLAARGYKVVLSVGDQESDLVGGYADATVQLPNPFYTVL
jgi:predicted secreted acid phosphatase